MTQDFAGIILDRLARDTDTLAKIFQTKDEVISTRHVCIDNLLPPELGERIYHTFPPPSLMRRMSSFRERKYTYKQLDNADPLVGAITFAFQDERIVRLIEKITGITDLIPDKKLYAGGISVMKKGDFLQPHIDNSHDAARKVYRRLNLLYYVTPGWRLESGGNLELWDERVRERVTITSLFNRLVLMETNKTSWHSVSKVRILGLRCCVSNYYFSRGSPDGSKYFHVTDFSAPPEQAVRRVIARFDGRFRALVRLLKRAGFSRRDFYRNQ